MFAETIKNRILNQFHFKFLLKWILVSIIVGGLSGSASAWFLIALEWAKDVREANYWLIGLLPIAGIGIVAFYHYWGKEVAKGSNQLIEEVQEPNKIIPIIMAPLVLAGTVLTHLFGGSAGREGTAVQMGGSIADQINQFVKFSDSDRKILIMCGIAAGFASVFGTPLAGALFALEIIFIGKIKYEAIIATMLSAFVANYACDLWPITHTHYTISDVPDITTLNIFLTLLASVAFGLAAFGFSAGMHWLSRMFKQYIKTWFLRPLIGGAIVALAIFLFGYQYAGLGVETIVDSFITQQSPEVFALKLILTVITLSCGFKGGEVTPLFFIGAALGSALSLVLPLPVSLLAGIGFVAVFSGATNSPLACSLMGMELFGIEAGVYITLACFSAYHFSGHTGIYTSQIIGRPKHNFLPNLKGKRLSEVMF